MTEDQKILLESVDILISQKIKDLKFCRISEGKITTVIDSINYKVLIDSVETNAKSTNGITYVVGDIVEIIEQDNSSFSKKILWKR